MYLLLFFNLFSWTSHDIQVAFFKIYEEDNYLYIKFELEKDDVITEFTLTHTAWSDAHMKQYLDQNFSCSVNGIEQKMKFESLHTDEKHISLLAKLDKVDSKVSKIEIDNTCFSNIEDHSNIIEVFLNDNERDFLMNNARTHIQINY